VFSEEEEKKRQSLDTIRFLKIISKRHATRFALVGYSSKRTHEKSGHKEEADTRQSVEQ